MGRGRHLERGLILCYQGGEVRWEGTEVGSGDSGSGERTKDLN